MSDNLPLQLTSFVGREREILRVTHLLWASRLVILTGPGGVGKTRFALQVARGLLDAYADGVWFVELAPLVDPTLVPNAVGRTLDLQDEPGRGVTDMIADFLGPRHMLLILDNCEHVVAACAELAEGLLKVCPGLKVLATSREALNVAGEVTWPVPSLAVPPPELEDGNPTPTVGNGAAVVSAAEGLSAYDAVRLFVERAQAMVPRFALTDENCPAVARICRRLDGLPLALELAASRVRVLSAEQIAQRLDDRFGLLAVGRRTAAPRHQTLRALIDWSYELLSEPEQRLFRRLSVFAGGWGLEAGEAVCSDDEIDKQEILGLLSQLVDKSLVLVEPAGRQQRYRLLETLRQYGDEKLQTSGEAPQVRTRHLEWFTSLAVRSAPEFNRAEQAAWLDRFETEIDNVRVALEWSRTEPSRADAGLRLAGVLWKFWFARGHLVEGWNHLVGLLGQSPIPAAPARARRVRMAARAVALNAAGRLGEFLGDLAQADRFLREAVSLNRELQDAEGVARSLCFLGIISMDRGDLATAEAILEESVAATRQLGAGTLPYATRTQLGWACYFQGKHARAQKMWEEGLDLARSHGDHAEVSNILTGMGLLALRRSDPAVARAHLTEAVMLKQSVGGAAQTLAIFACLAATEGRPERALTLAGAATALRTGEASVFPPARQAEIDGWMVPARRALGEAEAASAWALGAVMNLEEAASYAIEDSGPRKLGEAGPAHRSSALSPPTRPQFNALTPRQREVAALVAAGRSNREIAEDLVISVGTAERHVANVLVKLGCHSRSQIAAWAVQQGLATPTR